MNIFLEFLKSEEARGVTHVLLDDPARHILRILHQRSKTPLIAKDAETFQRPARAMAVAPAAATLETTQRTACGVDVGTGTNVERLQRLREQALAWTALHRLETLRDILVFSAGNPNARLVMIGEAPGYDEERHKEPFVGPAGKKLDDILKAMGLGRRDIYMTNVVKNRPAMPRQATNNRKPTQEEVSAWLPVLKAELAILKPDCIVALGTTAAEGLLAEHSRDVESMRGRWHEYQGCPVRVTHHPSYLLRQEGRSEPKRQLWIDMLAVMELLNLPISDKQRAYFAPKPA